MTLIIEQGWSHRTRLVVGLWQWSLTLPGDFAITKPP